MPVFSKMMSSYPFQLIKGLGPGIGVGAGVGAAYGVSGRRGSMSRGAGYAAAGGVLGGAGLWAARRNNIAVNAGLRRGGAMAQQGMFRASDYMMAAAAKVGKYSPRAGSMGMRAAGAVERGGPGIRSAIRGLSRFL